MKTNLDPPSEPEITINGERFQLGERIRLDQIRFILFPPYAPGIYEVTWIGHQGTYLSLKWSPRPNATHWRRGMGTTLSYLAEQGYEVVKLGARRARREP